MRSRPGFYMFILLNLLLFSIHIVSAIGEPTPTPDFSADLFDFSATLYDGTVFNIADHRGKAVIVNFWTTANTASWSDAMMIQSIWERYASAYDVIVLGINQHDLDVNALDFANALDLDYLLAPDPDFLLAASLQVETLPQTFVFDLNGQMVANVQGALEEGYLEQVLNSLLRLPFDTELIGAPVPSSISRYEGLPQGINAQGYPTLGYESAPVILEDYSSFSCPHCLNFHTEVFPKLLKRIETGDVLYVYVPIYFTGPVPNGWNANRAALCAADQGQFWPYTDMLFEWHRKYNQTAFDDARLRQGSANLRLNLPDWDDCMNGTSTDRILEQAETQAQENVHFFGTPSIFINGIIVQSTFQGINNAINDIVGEPL